MPPPQEIRSQEGLIKGNQWLIVPDHKASYFLGETWHWGGGGGYLKFPYDNNPNVQEKKIQPKLFFTTTF